jgi:hypothetical protein
VSWQRRSRSRRFPSSLGRGVRNCWMSVSPSSGASSRLRLARRSAYRVVHAARRGPVARLPGRTEHARRSPARRLVPVVMIFRPHLHRHSQRALPDEGWEPARATTVNVPNCRPLKSSRVVCRTKRRIRLVGDFGCALPCRVKSGVLGAAWDRISGLPSGHRKHAAAVAAERRRAILQLVAHG